MTSKTTKPTKAAVAGSVPVCLTLKVGDNHLEVSGPEDYVVQMRSWFTNWLNDMGVLSLDSKSEANT